MRNPNPFWNPGIRVSDDLIPLWLIDDELPTGQLIRLFSEFFVDAQIAAFFEQEAASE